MNKNKIYPTIQAILAAILFGISAPLSKVLLGSIDPVPLVSFMYLGSAIGLLILQSIVKFVAKKKPMKRHCKERYSVAVRIYNNRRDYSSYHFNV